MDTASRISLIVLGLLLVIAPIDAQETQGRRGIVRPDGRAVTDDRGPFNALGATLFWAAWGHKFDRPRLERALGALRDAKVDYIRVLGAVGGETWRDRETDPRWPDYDAQIAGLTDLAYDRFGLRVQWTIFGGAPFTPSGRVRAEIVDRFARMARGREHKIFAFEIANESWQNGFEGPKGVAELRSLGKRLNDQTPVIVALSAPPPGGACPTYAGAGADAITIHYERGFGSQGALRPARRPWTFPSAYDENCRGQLPRLVFNNEPIGPESSVRDDDDPGRIAASFVLTFLAGNASYVFHTGPGIRGGGALSKLKRTEHLDELPSFRPITSALQAAKSYLPAGVPNWTRHDPGAPNAPFSGSRYLYAASSGRQVVAVVAARQRRSAVTLTTRTAASVDVKSAATGKTLKALELKPGESFQVPGNEPTVLVATTAP